MNKKLSRLLEPGMGLYFLILFSFAGVAAALCVSENVTNKTLDTDLLRAKMAEGGSIIF